MTWEHDCEHPLEDHEGDGYEPGVCLVPGCFCGWPDVTVSAKTWAAVTGLPDQWRGLATGDYASLSDHDAGIFRTARLCADELERATKGEG